MVQCHMYCIDGSAGTTRIKCTARMRLRVISDQMRLILMPIVGLTSMKQCAKTYEVQRTPTPVRVTKVLPGPTLGRPGATPRGLGRDFYWCGPISSASQLFRTLKNMPRSQCRGRWRPGARATHCMVGGQAKRAIKSATRLGALLGLKFILDDLNSMKPMISTNSAFGMNEASSHTWSLHGLLEKICEIMCDV